MAVQLSGTTATVADADGVTLNDNGTMSSTVQVTDLAAYS